MDLKLLPCQLPSQSTCRNGPRLGWVINVATEMIIVNVISDHHQVDFRDDDYHL